MSFHGAADCTPNVAPDVVAEMERIKALKL